MENINKKQEIEIFEDSEGKYCKIFLTGKFQGQYYAKVDIEDYLEINKHRWSAWCRAGEGEIPVYAKRTITKRLENGKRQVETIKMHRQIIGAGKRESTDHKNGDGLDNRRLNIRRANHKQNMQNSKNQKHSSKYKGVSKDRYGWRVSIRLNGKTRNMGTYKIDIKNGIDEGEIKAARIYDDAAIRYFGSFARLNFPDERNIIHIKDGDYKMSYLLKEKEKRKIIKSLNDLRSLGKLEIYKILENKSLDELRNMCHFLMCGIGDLVSMIRKYRREAEPKNEMKAGVEVKNECL